MVRIAAGELWYPKAAEVAHHIGEVAQKHGRADRSLDPLEVGAGLISASSPNTDWELNKLQAHELAKHGEIRTTPLYVEDKTSKGRRIMSGEDPNSVLPAAIKTGNF